MVKEDCKYGAKCYQKNPAHREKYNHPAAKLKTPEKKESENSAATSEQSKRSKSPNMFEEIKKCKRPDSPETIEDDEDQNMRTYLGISRPRYPLPEVNIDVGMMSDIYDPQIEFSKKEEYKELIGDPKLFIKHKFMVDMPADFYSFWEFCKTQVEDHPEKAFEKFGLMLVGAFDVLAKKFDTAEIYEPADYLRHWRFYFDTPEFQTVLVKDKTGLHYGYWRDDPQDQQCFLASNDVNKGCEIKIFGCNIFGAALKYLEEEVVITPFNRPQVNAMKKSIEVWTKEHNFDPKDVEELKKRKKNVVCRTFHTAGLVVPFDRKKEVGYRGLLESDSNLKKILSKFDKIDNAVDKIEFDAVMEHLQPIITAAFIAVDECDFGTALELGIALFCHGTPNLHDVLRPLFITGYTMIQRPQYIAILKSHLEDRRRGIELDLLAKKV